MVILSFSLVSILHAGTLTIATYNILNFPDALGMQRIDDFRVVIDYLNPDVFVVQEILSQAGVNLFLDSVMTLHNSFFEAVQFHDGPDTDNGLFYRKDKVDFLSAHYISTANRDIARYSLRSKESLREFYIFSVHFKASQGVVNESLRLAEATVLRYYLDSLTAGTNFLVVGDFNIYYGDEPAFHKLTDSLLNNNGRLFDPLNASGYWHENSNFASIHTQSSRLEQLVDGGAGGGLDDRFDMILCSRNFLDSTGLFLVSQSYTTCGNDGNHFNNSINYGYNQAVPQEVADALYYATDHLPVFVEITDDIQSHVSEDIVQIWPNPMDTWADIRFPWFADFQKAEIIITNVLGQRVYSTVTHNPEGITFERDELPIGIYFVHIRIETKFNTYDYHAKLAIIR